ncbi:hypothetical protein [Sorangium sp. So ce1151]|uniref:hypothetical protein n=1 Tax=Sorangium sp. So ce1151 TaxID=3133332 RepID=UPI003F617DA3
MAIVALTPRPRPVAPPTCCYSPGKTPRSRSPRRTNSIFFMHRRSPWLSRAGTLLVATLIAGHASAQTALPSPQAKETARALADRGWDHYQNGRYAEALQAFDGAEASVHAPPFLLMIARTHDKLGRLLQSRATYRRLVSEELAPGSPRAFVVAKDDAKQELAALEPRIPTLEVTVTGTAQGGMKLALDGEPIAPATPVELDPGEHRLVAVAPGQRTVTKTLRLREGTRDHVLLDLTPPPPAASPPDRASAGSGSSMTVIIGGGVAAGAGAVAGVVFTLVANSKASDKRKQWHQVHAIDGGTVDCLKPAVGNPAQQCEKLSSLVDDKYLFSNLAMWSFIGGGAAALGTLGYYWLVPSSREPDSKQAHIFPFITTSGFGLAAGGTF